MLLEKFSFCCIMMAEGEKNMKETVTWILSNKSDTLAILSILLGAVALIQSWKYNRDSGKIAKDTSFMLVQQVILLNELKKNAIKNKNNQSIIDMSKDGIKLHKLSGFKKRSIPTIMEYINQLVIKKRFKEEIEKFLKSTDANFECDFFNEAQSNGDVNIAELYEILLKYNVIMIIKYH